MKLSVDIEKLLKAATDLENAHNNYSTALENIFSCIESTKEYWQGKDNEKIVEKALAFRTNLNYLSELISMYASFLREVASGYDEIDSKLYDLVCKC